MSRIEARGQLQPRAVIVWKPRQENQRRGLLAYRQTTGLRRQLKMHLWRAFVGRFQGARMIALEYLVLVSIFGYVFLTK